MNHSPHCPIATLVGPATAALCDRILEQRPHPKTGLSLLPRPPPPGALVGLGRLEASAGCAPVDGGALTDGSVRSILAARSAARISAPPRRRTCPSPKIAARANINKDYPVNLLTHPTLDLLQQAIRSICSAEASISPKAFAIPARPS